MRVAHDDGGGARDLLSHDWLDLVAMALPGSACVPLANVGAAAGGLVADLRLDAVVLTGGNDVGACPRRDATEASVLRQCLSAAVPVLGVCRGLQMVQAYFGGVLAPAPAAHDGGRTHAIELTDARAVLLLGTRRLLAPSYHRFGVACAELAPPLEAWGVSEDGLVEVLAHRSAPLVAVQWHPERPLHERAVALRLLRGFTDVL